MVPSGLTNKPQRRWVGPRISQDLKIISLPSSASNQWFKLWFAFPVTGFIPVAITQKQECFHLLLFDYVVVTITEKHQSAQCSTNPIIMCCHLLHNRLYSLSNVWVSHIPINCNSEMSLVLTLKLIPCWAKLLLIVFTINFTIVISKRGFLLPSVKSGLTQWLFRVYHHHLTIISAFRCEYL